MYIQTVVEPGTPAVRGNPQSAAPKRDRLPGMAADSSLPRITAALANEGAHAARNHVATVLAAAQLVDDAEVATALREAGTALLGTIDRTIASAQVELGLLGLPGDRTLRDALVAGARRATREGWTGEVDGAVLDAFGGVQARGPGVQLERLLADLLLGTPESRSSQSTHLSDGKADLQLERRDDWPTDAGGSYLAALAAACGGSLDLGDEAVVRLTLPVSPAGR